jgi:hypothetical protein
MKVKEKFITDDKGKTISVILDIGEYKKLQAHIDELEDVVLYDKAKKSKDGVIPFDKAIAEIEKGKSTKKIK